MAAFAISSYTIQGKQKKLEDGRRINYVKIVMGDAASTYPSGGLSLNKGNLGCPTNIDSVKVIDDAAQGIKWAFDATNVKMRAFLMTNHSHDVLLKNAAVADGATTRVNAGANLLGANTGGDLTVTGGGANGGVVAKSDLALSEASTAFVLPTHTILVEVIGY